MKIKIKCPVCSARNELNPSTLNCRRCAEDLSLLYRAKGYSLKFRLQLAQRLRHSDQRIKQQLAQAAQWLESPKH